MGAEPSKANEVEKSVPVKRVCGTSVKATQNYREPVAPLVGIRIKEEEDIF